MRQLNVLVLAAFGLTLLPTNEVRAAIITAPFAPLPGESVKITVSGTCVAIDRWTQFGSRVVFFGENAIFGVRPSGCFDSFEATVVAAGPQLVVELWSRSIGVTPPDGYALVDYRTVQVSAATARQTGPTSIGVTDGIAQATTNGVPSIPVTVVAKDISGLPVANARVVVTFNSLSGAFEQTLSQNGPRYTDGAGLVRLDMSAALAAAYQPGDYVTYAMSLADALDAKPQVGFATVGVVSPKFSTFAMPVVEYEFLSPPTTPNQYRPAYFLTSDQQTMQALDALPSAFRRTLAVFTALVANAPDAVPVCRFFSDGRDGRPLTHWYTADAADCAAKRSDSNWRYEGIAFWALAAREGGYCPPSSRAVYRLLYSNPSTPNLAIARFTQHLSIRNGLLATVTAPTDNRWVDDGVAFCAPE